MAKINQFYKIEIDGRIDQVLNQMGILPRQKWKNKPQDFVILMNGKKITKPSTIVKTGQEVQIEWQNLEEKDEPKIKLEPTTFANLKIVYEDDFLMIVRKPAGILVYPTINERDSLANQILAYFHHQKNHEFDDSERAGITHRLDRDTSGLLIVAKTKNIFAQLQAMFANQEITKKYLAVVRGVMKNPNFVEIQLPIGHDPHGTIKMVTGKNAKNPKSAHTTVRVVSNNGEDSLVECILHTGRTHQIRVHLVAIGFPIKGDPLYSNEKHAHGQQLHCHYLSFKHPLKNNLMIFRDLPPEWKEQYEKSRHWRN